MLEERSKRFLTIKPTIKIMNNNCSMIRGKHNLTKTRKYMLTVTSVQEG